MQTPEKFPEKVDFITSVGHLRGGNSRKEAGLLGNGPVAVISQCGVFDFEPETKRMRVKSLHLNDLEIAQMCTGFELLKPQGEIPLTPMPSPDIIDILRPRLTWRVFTSLPQA